MRPPGTACWEQGWFGLVYGAHLHPVLVRAGRADKVGQAVDLLNEPPDAACTAARRVRQPLAHTCSRVCGRVLTSRLQLGQLAAVGQQV
jgi:hypothetical protein